LDSKQTYPVGDMERGALVKNKLVGKTDLFYCPVDVERGLIRGPNNSRATSCLRYNIYPTDIIRPATSYVINSSIAYGNQTFAGARKVRRFSEFNPSAFLFIEESSGDTTSGEPASNCNQAYISANDPNRTLTARHRGGGYVACMDGHVEWMRNTNPDDPNDKTTFEYSRRWATGTDWYQKSDTLESRRWNP
jgi:hypothetical protein